MFNHHSKDGDSISGPTHMLNNIPWNWAPQSPLLAPFFGGLTHNVCSYITMLFGEKPECVSITSTFWRLKLPSYFRKPRCWWKSACSLREHPHFDGENPFFFLTSLQVWVIIPEFPHPNCLSLRMPTSEETIAIAHFFLTIYLNYNGPWWLSIKKTCSMTIDL